uniref:uncharacterized protein LOC122585576 n=1 Tax=Erigeron canadensis TaxID=72917 RepID=UPI001CB96723|nr:uncharacterized protein LOC122585576 [Erigeron canadensis]
MARGGGAFRMPAEKEVEVAGILLNLPKLISKYEILSQYSFTWGSKKKRSFLPSSLLKNQRPVDDQGLPEKVTAAEATQSPSTPFCFLPSFGKNLKRKATVDLMERYNGIEQESEIVVKEAKPMETHHQELSAQNMELKAKRQEINYSKSIADFQSFQLQLWNNSMQQQMMMMQNDLRAINAAAADARKRRMLKLKQDKYNSFLVCHERLR